MHVKVLGYGFVLEGVFASEYQIQALDVLPCGKEKIFLESEKLGKLDMFIVGKLVFKI